MSRSTSLLDLNHDVLELVLSWVQPPRELHAFLLSNRAAHDLALPHFISSVRLTHPDQVPAFCAYMLDPARGPERLRHLRSLAVERGASVVRQPRVLFMKLSFPAGERFASVLAGAPRLTHLDVRLADHVLSRDPRIARALSCSTPQLARLDLDGAGARACQMLAQWPPGRGLRELSLDVGDFDVRPLLAPHRATLRALSLSTGIFASQAQFPAGADAEEGEYVWPEVTELTLQNVLLRRGPLARAFPNVRRLRALDGLKKRAEMRSWNTDEAASRSGSTPWTKLEDLLVDVAAVHNLGLNAPGACPPAVRHVELARTSVNEKTSFMASHFLDVDDDPDPEIFLGLVRATSPASLTFRLRPSSIPRLRRFFEELASATRGSLRVLHLELFARSQSYLDQLRKAMEALPGFLAPLSMTYLCLVVDAGGAPFEQTLLCLLQEEALVSTVVERASSVQVMEVRWLEASWRHSWWTISRRNDD
ncbi:hypothetical protein PUNSTDRAFT_125182, partial [Punctularia strigosozonata HHB-11173 SS5]|uniref:uncharacterized protein n=1 Tax=Punctularia strigosozonata (strain HHB-11173) TaxID=741275 RepID=UPI00044179A0